ncbi:MAG TPA: hypothetical protein DD412_02205 [Holosporales bacterium]|nr:hypothetical protein [Holosporales bacterium]
MTNYMKSALLTVLFFLTLYLVLFTPQFKNAAFIFYDQLPLIKEQGVRSVLSTSPAVQGAVQEFASKAILLYLTFALVAFLLFSIKIKDPLAKWVSRTLTALLIMGMVGFIYQPYKSPVISYETTKKRPDISLTPGDELKTLIHFNAFQKDFKVYLDKALRGEIRAFIQPYFIGNFHHQFFIGDYRLPPTEMSLKLSITPETLNAFMQSKEITIQSKMTGNTPFVLRVRDLNKQSRSRQDTLSLNGNALDLKKDSMLLLFGFETNDGKPLIAFY